MASLKYYLDTRRLLQNGQAPLKIAVRNKSLTAYIPTLYSIPPSCWDGSKVVRGKDVDLMLYAPKTFNEILKGDLARYEVAMRKFVGVYSNMPATMIRDRLMESPKGGRTLNDMLRTGSERTDISLGTRKLYVSTLHSVEAFAGKVPLECVDRKWVERYVKNLDINLKAGTTRSYIDKVKWAMSEADRQGLYHPALDPFASLKLPPVERSHRDLPVEELRHIMLDEQTTKVARLARDYFKLTFCLCGINLVDLRRATPKDVINGRLVMKRQKTGGTIDIRIEPEAEEIIHRYATEDSLAGELCLATAAMCYRLGKLREGLTTYYARHSWATMADQLDISEKIIAMGLSHRWSEHVTSIYVNTDRKKLDAANRRVLDYVFYGQLGQ